MKKVLLIALAIGSMFVAQAQTAEDSIKASVNLLFEGMRNADGSKIAAAFADSAILQTIGRVKQGGQVVKNESVQEFINVMSKMAKGDADERITIDVLKIDGDLAMVWAPYKFYYKGKFSHCGVDSFQLVRINGKWKIQYLIDTRRTSPCE